MPGAEFRSRDGPQRVVQGRSRLGLAAMANSIRSRLRLTAAAFALQSLANLGGETIPMDHRAPTGRARFLRPAPPRHHTCPVRARGDAVAMGGGRPVRTAGRGRVPHHPLRRYGIGFSDRPEITDLVR